MLYSKGVMNAEQNLENLKLEMPPVPKVAGLYKPLLLEGNLAYFSGHLPLLVDGSMITGKVGVDLTVEQGAMAARQVGLNVLATLRANLGSLNRISRVVKILGMVNADAGFSNHPQVINGCSELFQEIWGSDLGLGVRSACGVSGLPGNASVEIEGVFKVHS